MAFNVNELRRASFNPLLKPVASPAYFEAYFNKIPNVLQDEVVGIFGRSLVGSFFNNAAQEVKERILGPGPASNVRFRVQAADLPQRQLETIPRFTNGPQRLVPFGSIYATTTIDVIESDQYDMRKFFDGWMSAVVQQATPDGKAVSQSNKYKMRYYDDIVAEFVIVAYAANGLPQARWTLKEAYPIAVNSSQLNWSSINQYVNIPVEIAYHEWEFKELNLTDILSDPAYFSAVARGAISGVVSTIL